MKYGLVLGCGDNFHGSNYEHLDIVDADHVDTVHDLETGKLPYEDNRFSVVIARNVLEHLTDQSYRDILKEVHRVSKPKAVFELTGPHYLCWNAPAGDHFRAFSKQSLNVYCISHEYPNDYLDLFSKLEINYTYRTTKEVKWLRKIVPDRIVRTHVPNTVEEITFVLKVVK